jgi:hypothetical protein
MTAAGFSPLDQPIYRVCSRAIAGAGTLVPATKREDWRREWEAELWHRVHFLGRAEQLTVAAQLDLLLRCLGSFRHAAWLRGRGLLGPRSVRIVRAAAHEVRAAPVTSGAIVVTLGLALGFGGMVFGVAWDGLRLPGHRNAADRVVRIWNRATEAELDRTALSAVEFARFHTRNRTLERVAAFRRGNLLVEGDDGRELVSGAWVTADFFRVFGRQAALHSGAGTPGAGDNTGVVLGHDLWERRFRADPRIVGRRIVIDGVPYRVSGIAPAGFRFPRDQAQVWLPLAMTQALASPGERMFGAVGVLRSGVSRADAHVDLTRLSLELQRERPATYFGRFGADWEVVVDPLVDPGQDLKPILLLLLGAAILTTVAAAGGSAVLARHRARTRVRSPTVLYQVFCTGAALGVGLVCCAGALRFTTPLAAGWLPGLITANLGLPTVGFVLLGAAIALAGMQTTGRSRSFSLRSNRGRVAGIAVAGVIGTVLLVAGTGFERSYRRLRNDVVGFRDGHLMVLPPASTISHMELWRDRARGLPGVQAVTLATDLPYVQSTNTSTFERASPADSLRPPATNCSVQLVDSDYFQVLGIPLLDGRAPASDRREAVVSHSMARRFWPGARIVGQQIQVYLSTAVAPVPVTVVGVVGDVRRRGLDGPALAELYLPRALAPGRVPSLVLRSTLTPDQLAAALGADSQAPRMLVMSEWVARAAAPYRVAAAAFLALALVAGLSAAVSLSLARKGRDDRFSCEARTSSPARR